MDCVLELAVKILKRAFAGPFFLARNSGRVLYSGFVFSDGCVLNGATTESIMDINLEEAISLLTRTPAALDVLLRDLPGTWTLRNEGDSTWSAFDVIGHLIHGERTDWLPRVRVILEFGENKAFEPFDRWGHVQESQNKSLGNLLDEFARLRSENVRELRALNLRAEDLNRRGRHPSLGVVTLSELLATWATHDLTHLHQISRVMAHQYRDAVGPWSQYLGVLQCAGHSSS